MYVAISLLKYSFGPPTMPDTFRYSIESTFTNVTMRWGSGLFFRVQKEKDDSDFRLAYVRPISQLSVLGWRQPSSEEIYCHHTEESLVAWPVLHKCGGSSRLHLCKIEVKVGSDSRSTKWLMEVANCQRLRRRRSLVGVTHMGVVVAGGCSTRWEETGWSFVFLLDRERRRLMADIVYGEGNICPTWGRKLLLS